MDIELVWGTGEGGTELSAFDAALAAGGIHNYNLVTLTSIIPNGASIIEAGTHTRKWEVGDLVPVVLARNESTVSGETIAAGLGWALAPEGGIFFEASAESRTNVESLLERGIETAKGRRPEWDWETTYRSRIVEHPVEDAGSAIVAAVYDSLDTTPHED